MFVVGGGWVGTEVYIGTDKRREEDKYKSILNKIHYDTTNLFIFNYSNLVRRIN